MSTNQPIVLLSYCCIAICGAIFLAKTTACKAEALPTKIDHLVINEVYTGTKASEYTDQFIELFNPTADTIQLSGYTINRKSGSIVDLSQFVQIESEQYLILYKSVNVESHLIMFSLLE